jgi:hypothetical protein
VADDNDESNIPEVIRLEDSSFLDGNFIRSEIHVAPGSGQENYGSAIRVEGGSGISGGYIDIRGSYGMPLPPEKVAREPTQIAVTREEREEIRRELVELARQINGLLRGNYPLSMHEASKRSGLGQDWPSVRVWRRSHDQALAKIYNEEILPNIIDVYRRARLRGFFDAELEKFYDVPVLAVAQDVLRFIRRTIARP